MKLRSSALALSWLLVTPGCMGTYSETRVSAAANVTSRSSDGSASVSMFYNRLEPYGYWAEYPQYGYCWVPRVGSSWRPYTNGRWAYTDYGWTWDSYEPFGWATYHYGRWWNDPYVGWVWVPGTTWAPAWVAWQYGDGYSGWAALPPEAEWSASGGFHSTPVIPVMSWNFVPEARLMDRQIVSRIEPADANVRILNRTRLALRFEARDGKPVNRGIDVEEIQRGGRVRVERERVAVLKQPARPRGPSNGPVEVFQPELRPAERDERPRAQVRPRDERDDRGVSQRAENERRRLERALEDEQRRLEQRQTAEMRAPADEPRRAEVQQRHAEERRKFQEFSERQKKEFEQRAQVRRKQGKPERDDEEQSNPRSKNSKGRKG